MVWMESPTNPMLNLVDIAAVAALARKRGILSVCDNTFATPFIQRPLDLGVDIVMHSATKYLNGHSDVLAGAVIVRDPALAEQLKFLQNGLGAICGAFDSFMLLRGLKTLAIRMERHCANGLRDRAAPGGASRPSSRCAIRASPATRSTSSRGGR